MMEKNSCTTAIYRMNSGANWRIPSVSALKTSTIPLIAPLSKPYVADITMAQKASIGTKLRLKLLGNSCPVTLLSGALGTNASNTMMTTAIVNSTRTALKANLCL